MPAPEEPSVAELSEIGNGSTPVSTRRLKNPSSENWATLVTDHLQPAAIRFPLQGPPFPCELAPQALSMP